MPLTHSQIDIVPSTSTEKPSDCYIVPVKHFHQSNKARWKRSLFVARTRQKLVLNLRAVLRRIRTKLGDHLHGYARVGEPSVVEEVLHGHVACEVAEQRDAVLCA